MTGELKDNVDLDIADAADTASYAHNFNNYQQQRLKTLGDAQPSGEAFPKVLVAAPIGCQVIKSNYPAMIPVGSFCTLAPYSATEVFKYIFDGTEDFFEILQVFFHHAAFSASGKQLICDVQGVDTSKGDLLLVDPCVLRESMPSLSTVVGTVTQQAQSQPSATADCARRFDRLHPRCSQICHEFDPQRKSAKRNLGCCGVNATCGLHA